MSILSDSHVVPDLLAVGAKSVGLYFARYTYRDLSVDSGLNFGE